MTRLSIRLLPGRSFELPPPHLELKAQARGNAFQMPPLPTFVQVVPHDQSGRVGLLTLTASGAALPPWSRRSTRRRPTRPRESLAPRSYPPSVRLASSSGKGKGPQRGPLELQGRDLNPRPPGYEPGELPDCSTLRRIPYQNASAARTLQSGLRRGFFGIKPSPHVGFRPKKESELTALRSVVFGIGVAPGATGMPKTTRHGAPKTSSRRRRRRLLRHRPRDAALPRVARRVR